MLSSRSNNESGEKVGNVEKQTMGGNRGSKWRVLGLHLSDLDHILDKHTLGDEEKSCVSPLWTGFGLMKRMIVDSV